MRLKQRILAWVTCAAMLLAPVASLAEADVYSIPAGEITTTAISDDYIGGEQINLSAGFGLNAPQGAQALAGLLGMDGESAEKKLTALTSLLQKATLEMSFYDDFGTARIHADLMLDGVSVLSGTALIYEDGSVQIMSNLTGQLVLALPAGTVSQGQSFDLFDLMYGEYGAEVDDTVPFEQLPARERLGVTAVDTLVMIFGHLLGWVSATQMKTGELYVFDDTYLEETDTRDAVAQRMVGTITTSDFMSLLWAITATLSDDYGLLQQAIADCLAEQGVTRYQVRQVVDALFTKETIDPATDYVQLSHTIPDDGTLCMLDDISYAFKKLHKSVDGLWYEVVPGNLSMIVSYDDYGGMVGFDAFLPQIAESLPYEGDFTYSIRTDENWQRLHTSHGELQVYGDNRAIGDLHIQFGQDVDGVNESVFAGQLDVVNQQSGDSTGVGVDAGMRFEASQGEGSAQREAFEGSATLTLRENGAAAGAISASLTGETQVDDSGFTVRASAALDLGAAALLADVTLGRAEYEDIPFAGGEAIDLSEPDDEKLERIQQSVKNNVAGIALSLAMHPSVLSDFLTLLGQ